MVLTPTKKIPLGYQAPQFTLLNPLTRKVESLDELKSNKATLIVFMCNHCPYVIHVLNALVELTNDYIPKGVSVIGINSNDIINYPDDSPEKMIGLIHNYKIPFPYLFDETQDVAKLYHAACTPDFSVFDSSMECVYRGQLDSARPGSDKPVTGNDIRMVFESILTNKAINSIQKPSIGCNIKWK